MTKVDTVKEEVVVIKLTVKEGGYLEENVETRRSKGDLRRGPSSNISRSRQRCRFAGAAAATVAGAETATAAAAGVARATAAMASLPPQPWPPLL